MDNDEIRLLIKQNGFEILDELKLNNHIIDYEIVDNTLVIRTNEFRLQFPNYKSNELINQNNLIGDFK